MRKIYSMLNWLRNKEPHKPVEDAALSTDVHSGSHYIKDGALYVNNVPVAFKYPAYKAIEMNSIVVVLLDIPQFEVFNENVLGVNSSGEIIWQIHKRQDSEENDEPYMNIWIYNNDEIRGNDSIGLNFIINPLDGSIEYVGLTK